ncbi:acyl-CoA dehydrogenase [Lentzea aerocolonigenes]|uniref:Acyl-CoA dehydrogenase n=1 Tax=Lentzea aerocolonigenes TaxID=68170 RepID=A0A0F0HBJ0_LENAE|nr:acyl-CoA dehydrogenase family protein [Lentzea aerocolonigenes]KJK51707.1 acyl-CoA dehydrogenase [Lentzea aerocolonigenes]
MSDWEEKLPGVVEILTANAARHDREASLPDEGIQAIHEAGLLTATVHERHGGPGAGLADTVTILRSLGRGDPSAALVTAMTMFAHALQGRTPTWPDDVYAEALRADRPVLINELQVEPDLGTPVRGGLPATVAVETGGGFELSGHKIYCTGAELLGWMVVTARVGDTEEVRAFLVRGDAPGVTVKATWDHLGLRGSRSDDVTFDRVPAVLTAPAVRDPLTQAWNSLGLAALYLGVADAARDWLVTFLAERTPAALGAPLATLPRFQTAVGEIDASLGTSWDLLWSLAERTDAGDDAAAARAPAAKLIATRAAIGAVEQAVALVGNNGLTRRNPLERHYRDVLCARVHTPQNDAIVSAAGRVAFAGLLP